MKTFFFVFKTFFVSILSHHLNHAFNLILVFGCMASPIHVEEFPRERLLRHGPQVLTDYELLAIILNTGTKSENVLELSKRITAKFPLKKLCVQNVRGLTNELGIGEAKACKILSIAELGRRLNLPEEKTLIVRVAKDVADMFVPKISHLQEEHLIAVYLNSRKRVLRHKTLFVGSLNESLINSREIFKIALEEGASAIILVHNHPSGDFTPSEADLKSTQDIFKAGEIMGIPLLDHIIIANNGFWSLKENGILP
jgi:DNA repair protein RadC